MNERITIINNTYEETSKVIVIATEAFTIVCGEASYFADKFKRDGILYDIHYKKRKTGWTWFINYGKEGIIE